MSDDATPMCTSGRPPSIVFRTLMKFGKFDARLFCLSAIDPESSMRNRMSMFRFTVTGMSLYSTRPWSGTTLDTVRSGHAVRSVVRPRQANRESWRMCTSTKSSSRIEQVDGQDHLRAVSIAYFRREEPDLPTL